MNESHEMNVFTLPDGSPDWEMIRKRHRPGDTFTVHPSMHFNRQNIAAAVNLYKLANGFEHSDPAKCWRGGVIIQGDGVEPIVHLGRLALLEHKKRARTASESRPAHRTGGAPRKYSDDEIRAYYRQVADGVESLNSLEALQGINYRTLRKRSIELGLAWPPIKGNKS